MPNSRSDAGSGTGSGPGGDSAPTGPSAPGDPATPVAGTQLYTFHATDSLTGGMVRQATVLAGMATGVTDGGGRVSFRLRPGPLELHAAHPDYATYSALVTLPHAGGLVPVRLQPLAPAILLSSLAFMAHHVVVLGVYFADHFWLAAVPLALCVACGGAFWAWLYQRTGSIWAASGCD